MTRKSEAHHHEEPAHEADAEKVGEEMSEQVQEAVDKGYSEDALTDQQKELLEYQETFRDEAEKMQDSDDPEDYNARRQQV